MSRPHPTNRQRQLRGASKRYWAKQVAAFRALGLTTRGTVPKYTLHKFESSGGTPHGIFRKRIRQRLYTEQLNARGLSKRGNPKRGLILLTPLETDYRLFRATVPAAPTMDWDQIERL